MKFKNEAKEAASNSILSLAMTDSTILPIFTYSKLLIFKSQSIKRNSCFNYYIQCNRNQAAAEIQVFVQQSGQPKMGQSKKFLKIFKKKKQCPKVRLPMLFLTTFQKQKVLSGLTTNSLVMDAGEPLIFIVPLTIDYLLRCLIKRILRITCQKQQMLLILLAVYNSLPLNVNGKDFMAVGTPSYVTFTFDAAASPIWTVLFSSFGTETLTGLVGAGLTVDASGMWMVYQATNGSAVIKISTAATALPNTTTANLNLTALTSMLPTGVTFNVAETNKVFKMCVYNGMGLTNASTGITPSCGSYHTFTTTKNSNSVDRNMGEKSTSWTGTGLNSYTFDLYSGTYNSTANAKSLNYGLVVTTTGTAAFQMWAATGINNLRMVNQDMIMQGNTGNINDGWSTSRSNSAVSADIATNCVNDMTQISYGTASQWKYWHGSRSFVTGDSSCDTDITATTQLCTIYQEGATVTDFVASGDHSSVTCGSFVVTKYMSILQAGSLLFAITYLV